MKRALSIIISMLIFLFVASNQSGDVAKAKPGPATSVPPIVNLSDAQVHAVISYIDGELWAKVDALYKMNTVYGLGDKFLTENYKMGLIADPSPYVTATVTYNNLEAYYPFPSDATNISVKLNDKVVKLISRNRSFHLYGDGNLPELTWMISPVPSNFTIKVHYDQPIRETHNSNLGEYAFLYSLGARFGLDNMIYGYYGYYWLDNSTAHFDLLVDPSFNDINAHSIEQLNPLNSTLSGALKCAVSAENEMKKIEFNVSAPASTLFQSLTISGAALLLNQVPEVSETSTVSPILFLTATTVCILVGTALAYRFGRNRESRRL